MKSKLEVKQVDGNWKWKVTAGTGLKSRKAGGIENEQNTAYENAMNFIMLVDWENERRRRGDDRTGVGTT